MTPEQLDERIRAEHLEVSFVAFVAEVDRFALRAYLNGDRAALNVDEVARLTERLIVPDELKRKRYAEYEIAADGVTSFLLKHSIHFQYEKNGSRCTASGTLIQIADHVFVATCNHTVPRGTQFLAFVGDRTQQITYDRESKTWSSPRNVAILGKGLHSSMDLGFIEIEPSALRVFERDAITLQNIAFATPQYGRFATLLGFPFDLEYETRVSPGVSYIGVGSLVFPGPILAPEEWPNCDATERAPNPEIDIFMRYDREQSMGSLRFASFKSFPAPRQLPDNLPAVYGMSGGGIWQSQTKQDPQTLWFPSDQKLLAIQYAWHPALKYLRAIHIKHWLELVSDKVPSLKDVIGEAMNQ